MPNHDNRPSFVMVRNFATPPRGPTAALSQRELKMYSPQFHGLLEDFPVPPLGTPGLCLGCNFKNTRACARNYSLPHIHPCPPGNSPHSFYLISSSFFITPRHGCLFYACGFPPLGPHLP